MLDITIAVILITIIVIHALPDKLIYKVDKLLFS